MRGSIPGRLLAAAVLSCSFVVALGGGASASPPRWSMTVTDLPAVVHNGSNAGYRVTISNAGPSNISSLFLVTKTQSSPSYVDQPTQGSCSAAGAGPLVCNFGALGAGASVTVVVAYMTPSSGTSFDPVFQGNSNGATYSDPNSTSHGDTLQDPNETPTRLTSDINFAGGFSLDTGAVGDSAVLDKNNVQSTSVVPPAADIVTTVQDGNPGYSPGCSQCTGQTLFGDWSRITVGHGEQFGDLFPVSILVFGKVIPAHTTLDQINLAHVQDDGTSSILSVRCGPTPTLNCVTVTPVGSNVRITAWVNQNGGVRGIR
jgi:Domain of unknown function DUF11